MVESPVYTLHVTYCVLLSLTSRPKYTNTTAASSDPTVPIGSKLPYTVSRRVKP